MKRFIYFLISISLFACQETKPKTVTSSLDKERTTETKKVILKDCTFEGLIQEGNQVELNKQQQVLAIVADETSKDAQLGDSHRVLIVKDRTDCSTVFNETLPISRSADFPYQIADLSYNNTEAFIAIKGYDEVYCYDIKNKKLLPVLEPKFINPREAQDAQSGQIVHLELWENYIIGYALDCGTFVFKIDETNHVNAVLPAAEYQPQGTDNYASLFSLPSMNGKTQFLMPRYDKIKKRFALNTMLNAPIQLRKNIIVSKDQRYALFVNQLSGDTFAVDLLKQARVALTSDQRAQKPRDILKQLQNAN